MKEATLLSVMIINLISLNNLCAMEEDFEKVKARHPKPSIISPLYQSEEDVIGIIWVEEYTKINDRVKVLHKESRNIGEIRKIISPMIREANLILQEYKKKYFSHTNKPLNIFFKESIFISD